MKLIYKPNSLKKHINSSRIVITAGGSTVYGVLSQRRIPIIFSLADNQDLICRELMNIGVEYLGRYPKIEYDKVGKMIENIQFDKDRFNHNIFGLIKSCGAR